MAEVKNTFTGGKMNQDVDSRIIPKGEYREAINLLISRSEGSTVGEFENILGNSQIPTGVNIASQNANVIGYFIDETNNRGFFLLTTFANSANDSKATASDFCYILEVSFDPPYNIKVLVSGYFLNFNKSFSVTGINLVENLLFWTDNFNQPRKININLANPSNLATPTFYTEEYQISVAKYYPWQPLIPMERLTATINSALSSVTNLVFATEQPDIKVGDIITDHNKAAGVQEKFTVLTKITKIINKNSFIFFPALSQVLPSGFEVDFSRTSMENKDDLFNSNNSIDNEVNAVTSTTIGIQNANYGGVPRIGDIVSAGSATVGGTANTALNNIGGNVIGDLTSSITTNTTNGDNTGSPYNSATYTTSGSGAGLTINVVVSGGIVTSIIVLNNGYGFAEGDTITIGTAVIGGSTNVEVTLKASDIAETRITGFVLGNANVVTAFPYRWQLTVDYSHNLTGGVVGSSTDWINIGDNPDYDQNFKGDSKFLEDKFVRFSYRFNFIDGEESLMAPFSQIMFIPKQYGEFGAGQLPATITTDQAYPDYNQDCSDSFKSTIIQWFENNIDSINLQVPLPASTPSALTTDLLVTSIDILYKESDALSVKVLDTIEISDLTSFNTISYNDVLHGKTSQSYLTYQYKSNKPYKTLTTSATTRVFDQVPVRALAQEVITNRIVYGNFVEKMTPPESIEYSVSTNKRNVIWDNYTQYPYHNLKQNRTYQVGFVLSDYYGRQSSVILSSFDDDTTRAGSSIYLPYRSEADAINSPVIDWLGEALNLTINQAIGETQNSETGEPGIYMKPGAITGSTLSDGDDGFEVNGIYDLVGTGGAQIRVTAISGGGTDGPITSYIIVRKGEGYSIGEVEITGGDGSGAINITSVSGSGNPLGWHSYKVVVKQQEQEYYNVYLPGFINGLPVWQNTTDDNLQRNKFALTTLMGDNVNKIPRDLKEVGPTDNEFSSEEILYIRVTNKDASIIYNVDNKTSDNPPPFTGSWVPWNAQYYPGKLSQNVNTIATMRETEYGAIPFVAYHTGSLPLTGHRGEYNSSITTMEVDGTDEITTSQPSGSIPWGDVGRTNSFYAQEENPYVCKFSTSPNAANQVGANVNDAIPWGGTSFSPADPYVTPDPATYGMEPFLSIVETDPTRSVLSLFYETSMCGLLEDINSAVSAGNLSIVAAEQTAFTFLETQVTNTDVGTAFKFIDGEGSTISTSIGIDATILKVTRQSAPNSPIVDVNGLPDYFGITGPNGSGEFQLKTKSPTLFVYTASSEVPNSSTDIYTITLEVTRTDAGEDFVSTVSMVGTLANVGPIVTDADLSTPDVKCNCPGGSPCPLSITSATTDIKTFYANNGSIDTTRDQLELVWSLGTISASGG